VHKWKHTALVLFTKYYKGDKSRRGAEHEAHTGDEIFKTLVRKLQGISYLRCLGIDGRILKLILKE
jgi:hypothetical protein